MNNEINVIENTATATATPKTKKVFLHEVFGFKDPILGFEEVIDMPAVRPAFCPDVDAGYVFDKSLVRRAILSYWAGESIMLVGDKGTGKSSFVQQFCARLNLPLMAINGGPGVDESYLLGCKTIEDGSVKNVDGILSYAVRHGIPVLIDEICALRPGVLVALNDILNGDKVITLKHHGIDPSLTPDELFQLEGSMTITRHPRFRLFATDNTGGKSEKDGRFAGINTQNSAVRSRFTSFKVRFMKPEFEIAALNNAVENAVDPMVINGMVEFAFRFRAAFEQGEAFDNISFRELKRWARKTAIYGDINEAFIDGVYSNLETSDQQLAENLFEESFGTELEFTDEYSESATSMLDQLIKLKPAIAA